MTTLLLDKPVDSSAGDSTEVRYGVLRVEGLPKRLRAEVEALMVRYLGSEPTAALPGVDPLYAHWCTRWERDGRATVRCREILTATPAEFSRLHRALSGLAQEEGFYASVEEVSAES
ncbi:hypothetical protein [Corynebacterium lowii]|uniref:Uncharacterized protein n=1 Tax=Corynebacterium lowii TaxID=1544413 RepID=A0A0Q0YWU9_9CORY|nr:hypothetical protein [Corynebacterium lowii]KQB86847.1 hypothetical protein Clow_01056 [Corynebacterium lowii]MDP9851535.1 hypothetical protein [Corynebacterium lowii]